MRNWIFINIKVVAFALVAFTVFIFVSCCKEKVPLPPEPVVPTKWEKISGDYKVYDTLGNYLYEMSIAHIHNDSKNTDSLHFENYGDLFTMTFYQSPWSGIPEGYIEIGSNKPIKDKFNKRWDLSQATNTEYNVLSRDTLILRYRRVNILYYLEDITPYCDSTIIEIAVKQH